MRKTSASKQLGLYFIATTLCLAIISTSLDGGLIKTTYGYGYGYGHGSDKDKNNNDSDRTKNNNDEKHSGKKEKKKKVKRLKNSKNIVRRGEILTQSGTGFKKNSKVLLYFSKPDGTFYPPVIVKTNSKGNFRTNYLVAKPAGTYKWYAVGYTTGKKTNTSSYTVVR